MLQLRAGVRGRELPVYLLPVEVMRELPGIELLLRRVVNLELRYQPAGLRGLEGVIERSDVVGVQIVHHQDDLLRIGAVLVNQLLHLVCPVDLGAVPKNIRAHPSGQGLDEHEYGARAVADVLAVYDHGGVRASEPGAALPDEL